MIEDQDFIAEITWEKKSLVEQWEARDETRIIWERRCMIEFGFIPTQALMHKTSWLLGCVLEMALGTWGSGVFYIPDLPVYRSAVCEQGQVIFSHPFAPADIIVSGDRLARWKP